jgi:GTP cyclohydrolase I
MLNIKDETPPRAEALRRPSDREAADAVRLLLAYIGEDVGREGLRETPRRVIKAFGAYFEGYGLRPEDILKTTFGEVEGYDDLVVLAGIRFESHCEHHLAPFIGEAAVGYMPGVRVVGLSKLARLVDLYAKRLQIQERLTMQIGRALDQHLKPRGAAVILRAEHFCLSCRGAHKPGARMTTSFFSGALREDAALQRRFLDCAAVD